MAKRDPFTVLMDKIINDREGLRAEVEARLQAEDPEKFERMRPYADASWEAAMMVLG